MASFQSILKVGGKEYDILYSNLGLGQAVDSLGRPASAVYGGTITIEMNTPANDPTLYEWMVNPEKRMDGQVILRRLDSRAVLKSIKFYNAYCVDMVIHFDGTANASSFKTTIRISPEQIEIGGLLHDNLWPDETPMGYIPDETAPKEEEKPKKKEEPSALSEGLHTLLDVVGMIPIVGEIADGANALVYAAEGDHANAALSAAAMIPLAGSVVGAAKLAKRGAKIIEKARGLKQAKKVWKSGTDLMEKGAGWAGKLQRGSTGFLGSPRLNRRQLNAFKEQAKQLGAQLDVVKDKKIIRMMNNANAQAGFDALSRKLYVRKGATAYEVAHEMTHAKHYADIGKDAYGKLSRLEKETHVFNELMKQPGKLTKREISHATDYLNGIRSKLGLDIIIK